MLKQGLQKLLRSLFTCPLLCLIKRSSKLVENKDKKRRWASKAVIRFSNWLDSPSRLAVHFNLTFKMHCHYPNHSHRTQVTLECFQWNWKFRFTLILGPPYLKFHFIFFNVLLIYEWLMYTGSYLLISGDSLCEWQRFWQWQLYTYWIICICNDIRVHYFKYYAPKLGQAGC